MELKLNNNTQSPNWQWLVAIIFLLAFSRLIPHPPNFTPVCAIAIFAGATLKDIRLALLIPLVALLISDAVIGFHSTMIFVYSAIAVIIAANYCWLKNIWIVTVTIAAISSSILFFIVTNFGAWLSHDMYPKTADGLMQAYIAGIPFFKNTLLGTLFFLAISFIATKLIARSPASEQSTN